MPKIFIVLLMLVVSYDMRAQKVFRVVGFFTAKNDAAHISFVNEANRWFKCQSAAGGFIYDSTRDWTLLNKEFLKNVDVLVFLDTRPEEPDQRKAFEEYMRKGGAWIGFHFSAFALTPSSFPQNWDWYHNEFLGSGQYKSNTWRPTSALLKNMHPGHDLLREIPLVFTSGANEWYRWEKDLRLNKDIDILLAIDSASFPLGTGPKAHEIWHSGFYPVVWTNRQYRMIYINMGHNDIDYEAGSNRELSHTFGNKVQDRLVLNAIRYFRRSIY